MKYLKNSLTLLALSFAVILAVNLTPFGIHQVLAAQPSCSSDLKSSATCGISTASGGSASGADFTKVIADVIRIISILVGVIAIIMIIIGGFRYMTSGGDSGKVSSAKNTIVYAIIGLAVAVLAQFIVQFVLGQANRY
ncbi:MAG TPA: hypothetical protein VFN51_00820 [Candidatus Saccharimonadales bacterium]|nr:hypothetical protein [Candidatus Saccharimonadales bacterium]